MLLCLCLPSSGSLVGFIIHFSFPGQLTSKHVVYCKCLCLPIKVQVLYINSAIWRSFYRSDATIFNVSFLNVRRNVTQKLGFMRNVLKSA